MSCDKKGAAKTKGAGYLVIQFVYYLLWVLALEGAKEECRNNGFFGKSSSQWYVENNDKGFKGGDVAEKVYAILTVMIILDLFLNRKFFMRLGRKTCMTAAMKQEFKRIKMCKKAQKQAHANLALLNYNHKKYNK